MLIRRNYPLLEGEAGAPADGGASSPAPVLSSDVDWLAESSDQDEGASSVTPAAPSAPVVAAPAAPTPVAPAATPTAPIAPPVSSTPPVVSSTPAQPPAPGTPGQPDVQQVTTQQPVVAPDYAALRTAELARLTTSYSISEDQARDIMVAPEQHLPALLANVHLQVFDEVARVILPRIPVLVQQAQANLVVQSQNEDLFYKEWPALKQDSYKATVENAIKAYRQLNPKATRAEVIRAAGLTASITHRLPIPQEMFNQPAPQAPQAPGFSHAAPGSAGTAVTPPGNGKRNPYDLLNEEFDGDLSTVG